MFIIGAIFLMMPLMAKAEEMKLASSTNNTAYGTINVSESKEWQNKPDGGKYIQQIYTVTKTSNGYVWIKLIETLNVKVTNVVEGSAFTLVSSDAEENTYLFKQKNGTTLSSETEVMTVIAEIVDPYVSFLPNSNR